MNAGLCMLAPLVLPFRWRHERGKTWGSPLYSHIKPLLLTWNSSLVLMILETDVNIVELIHMRAHRGAGKGLFLIKRSKLL